MAKVKTNFKQAEKDIKRFKKQASKELAAVARQEIVGSIERGNSPVKGFGRYDRYSESYDDAIRDGRYSRFGKRIRPVNLKLTGQLLSSFFSKVTSKGVEVGFDNKLADIHNNKGAGKSKAVRRMLPTEKGEQFSRSITTRFREVLDRVANNIFKR